VARFVSERLAIHHDLTRFHSGVDALDRWLMDHATHAQSMRTAQTFVWHEGDGPVVGYYSLAAHLVVRAELPQKVGRGSPASIPAVLLARLALNATLHGEGLRRVAVGCIDTGLGRLRHRRRPTGRRRRHQPAGRRLLPTPRVHDGTRQSPPSSSEDERHRGRPCPPIRLVERISA